MRETILNLRDGWYGNIIAPTPGVEAPAIIRGNFDVVWSPTNYAKHIEHPIKECNKRILWCGGIKGTMLGGVTILPWYIADTAVLIDAIIDPTQTDHHNPNEDDTGQAKLPFDGNEIDEGGTAVDGKYGNEKDCSEFAAPPVVPAVITDNLPTSTASL